MFCGGTDPCRGHLEVPAGAGPQGGCDGLQVMMVMMMIIIMMIMFVQGPRQPPHSQGGRGRHPVVGGDQPPLPCHEVMFMFSWVSWKLHQDCHDDLRPQLMSYEPILEL